MEVTIDEMIEKIHDMVLSDRRIEVREIVEATGISQGTVFSILLEKLGMKKMLARCVPRLLLKENKRIVWSTLRLVWRFSVAILTSFCVDTYLWTKHEYTTTLQTETKEQSKQWVFESERAPKKAKTVKSVGKVMTTVF